MNFENSDIYAYLKSNEKLERLIRSIDYSDGSIFNLIYLDNYKLLEEVLIFTQARLQEDGNKKEILSVIQTKQVLLKEIFKEIDEFIYVTKNSLSKSEIIVFDMSFLDASKSYEIEVLFSKLNQLRNSLMNLDVALIFAFPKSLKKDFLQYAPDFWSVKSVDADIDFMVKELKSLTDDRDELNSEKSLLLNQYKMAKEEGNSRELMIAEIKLGDFYAQHDDLSEANSYYIRALKLAQEIQNRRPDSIEAMRDVSISLEKTADIYLQKGDSTKALKNCEDGLKLREEIQNRRPDSIEAMRDLVVSYYKLATSNKNKEVALGYYQKALEIANSKIEYLDFEQIVEVLNSSIEKIKA